MPHGLPWIKSDKGRNPGKGSASLLIHTYQGMELMLKWIPKLSSLVMGEAQIQALAQGGDGGQIIAGRAGDGRAVHGELI